MSNKRGILSYMSIFEVNKDVLICICTGGGSYHVGHGMCMPIFYRKKCSTYSLEKGLLSLQNDIARSGYLAGFFN